MAAFLLFFYKMHTFLCYIVCTNLLAAWFGCKIAEDGSLLWEKRVLPGGKG